MLGTYQQLQLTVQKIQSKLMPKSLAVHALEAIYYELKSHVILLEKDNNDSLMTSNTESSLYPRKYEKGQDQYLQQTQPFYAYQIQTLQALILDKGLQHMTLSKQLLEHQRLLQLEEKKAIRLRQNESELKKDVDKLIEQIESIEEPQDPNPSCSSIFDVLMCRMWC